MDKFGEDAEKVLRFYKQYGKDPNGDSVSLAEIKDLDTVERIQEFITDNVVKAYATKTTEVEKEIAKLQFKPEDLTAAQGLLVTKQQEVKALQKRLHALIEEDAEKENEETDSNTFNLDEEMKRTDANERLGPLGGGSVDDLQALITRQNDVLERVMKNLKRITL